MKFKNMFIRLSLIVSMFLFSLACTPTITLGWAEIAIIIFLGIVLLGPVIFGLMRRLGFFRDKK